MYDTGNVDAQGDVGSPPPIHLATHHPLSVLHRYATLTFLDQYNGCNHPQSQQGHDEPLSGFMVENILYRPPGKRETILAKIISDIPLPRPLSLICSPSHMMRAVPTVSVKTIKKNLNPVSGF